MQKVITEETVSSTILPMNGHASQNGIDLSQHIVLIIERDNPSEVFNLVPQFAHLSSAQYLAYKTQLKEHFKGRLKIRQLDAVVKKQWRENNKAALLDSSHPTVIVNHRQLRDVTNDTLSALYKANSPPKIFTRSGSLVRIVQNKNEPPYIDTLTRVSLRSVLTRVADFYTARGDDYVDMPPPLEVCDDILSLSSLGFPPLEGIIQTPIVRSDGTILDTPGYDEETRLCYLPNADFPKVPEIPTEDDIKRAKAILNDPIEEFVFDTNGDKTTFLGAEMTPILAQILGKNRPMFGLDAPRQGTGKTHLVEQIGVIATGETPHLWPETVDDEEMRKRITTVLQTADPVFAIDNIEHIVNFPSLNSLVTTQYWQDRGLATQKSVRYKNSTTVFLTANNLKVGRDTERRYIPIRLNARQERPWERTGFKYDDIVEHTKDMRPQIVWAILTLARNWFVQGCPNPSVTPIGSFERWTIVIGGILELAGYEGFLSRLSVENRQVDEETVEWEGFLEAWHKVYGSKEVTARQLIADLNVPDESISQEIIDLKGCIPVYLEDIAFNPNRKGDATKRLGNALSKRRDMIVGDYTLMQGKKSHNAVTYVVQCAKGTPLPPNQTPETSQQQSLETPQAPDTLQCHNTQVLQAIHKANGMAHIQIIGLHKFDNVAYHRSRRELETQGYVTCPSGVIPIITELGVELLKSLEPPPVENEQVF